MPCCAIPCWDRCSEKDFHEFAEYLEAVRTKGHIAVVASPADVEAANKQRPGLLNPLNVL